MQPKRVVPRAYYPVPFRGGCFFINTRSDTGKVIIGLTSVSEGEENDG